MSHLHDTHKAELLPSEAWEVPPTWSTFKASLYTQPQD